MNKDFPRIITFLRKERGLSQKQVAGDMGISQALLSHYEKGIRECGLDFLVKTAEYYGVSTDYLLGRTVQRNFTADPFEAAEKRLSSIPKRQYDQQNKPQSFDEHHLGNLRFACKNRQQAPYKRSQQLPYERRICNFPHDL